MKNRVIILILCAGAILLSACSMSSRQSDYICKSADALEVLVPKYLEYVNAQVPEYQQVEDILKKVVAPAHEKGIIERVLMHLKARKSYSEEECGAINASYQQLLSAARTARDEAQGKQDEDQAK